MSKRREVKRAKPVDALKDDAERVGGVPKELGVLLIVVGIGGILLPGPIGSPFLLVGAVSLWPRVFGKVETAFQKRFPSLHRQGSRQIKRFIADLENRYPLAG